MPILPDIFRVLIHHIYLYGLETGLGSTVLDLVNLALSRFFQPKWNFLNHLVTALWSIAPSSFTQQMFFVTSTTLWPSSNLVLTSNYTLWSNVQHVSTPTTTILPTTAGTFHSLNSFRHVIYTLQTNTYWNIAKLLTHPSILPKSIAL